MYEYCTIHVLYSTCKIFSKFITSISIHICSSGRLSIFERFLVLLCFLTLLWIQLQ